MPYFYAIFTIYLINLEKKYIFTKPVFLLSCLYIHSKKLIYI